MKKNRWRQGAASVAAAAGQSELARCLLQWELADLLPTDSLPLPALLALGQSPQLLAAQEEISRMQAVSPEKAEAPAPPDESAAQDEPQPPSRRRRCRWW